MMKKLIILFIILYSANILIAQNVGIGTTEPMNKLQLHGNLLVTAPTTATITAPTVSQTKTMVNATTITFLGTDSTGRIYDPGGPAANYLANMTANTNIAGYTNTGIEITIESMGLGTGDSLIIKESAGSSSYLLAVGNGYTSTGKWVFNSSHLYIIFKSNADATTGSGFSLLFKRLYDNSASLPDVSGATGNSLLFDTKTGSFRSGNINNAEKGEYSTAFGSNPTASGDNSLAIGYEAIASGHASTAIGSYVSTNNQVGSFVIGDLSTPTVMNSPAPNNFRARFDNGYRLYTSSDYSTSCSLGAGDNAWTTTSDVHLKENFETVNGEDFLKKIATMRLVSWNYKKQDPSKFRHYGPMAQDFYAAFGKDKYGNIGNDTTINQADFDGVNLIAIQALEKRTAELKKENAELRAIILQLQKDLKRVEENKSLYNTSKEQRWKK